MKTCFNCGAENTNNANYCNKCGIPIEEIPILPGDLFQPKETPYLGFDVMIPAEKPKRRSVKRPLLLSNTQP